MQIILCQHIVPSKFGMECVFVRGYVTFHIPYTAQLTCRVERIWTAPGVMLQVNHQSREVINFHIDEKQCCAIKQCCAFQRTFAL